LLTITERPLTPAELQHLSARLKAAHAEGRSTFMATVLGGALVCLFLAVLTINGTHTPPWMAILFWSSLTIVVIMWTVVPTQRSMDDATAMLNQAVRTNLAHVTHVQSARVVEFEKDDHEGVCYAFEIDAESSLFLVGQAFREGDGFPNSDFSIVEILAARGRPLETVVEKHGVTLTPVAVIPNASKSLMVIPEHMSVLPLPLDRITEGLPHRRR